MEEKNVNEEMDCGFSPEGAELALNQISQPALDNRKLGFNALINTTSGDFDQHEVDILFASDIFQHVIDAFNESNLPIIDLICNSFLNLMRIKPEDADMYCEKIPIEFLVQVSNVIPVIEFFSSLVLNSLENVNTFADSLVANEAFQEALSNWLQSSDTKVIQAALDLITSFSIYNEEIMDFSIVKPFVDPEYPTDIRALALSTLLHVEPSDEYYEALIGLLGEENVGPVVFEVIHDLMSEEVATVFANVNDEIINKAIEHFDLGPACLLLEQMHANLDEEQTMGILERFFQLKSPTNEQCLALHSIAAPNQILNAEQLVKLATYYARSMDLPKMQFIEDTLEAYPEFLQSEEMAHSLAEVLEREPQFASRAFQFVLSHYAQDPVPDELMNAFGAFLEANEAGLSDFEQDIGAFLEAHK